MSAKSKLIYRMSHAHGPAGQCWPVIVDVYLNDASKPDFDIKTNHTTLQGSDPKHPRLVFNELERTGGYNIDFVLWDNTGGQYKFPSKAKDAVWSKIGSICPTSACYDVFVPKKVWGGGLTLTVFNDNQNACMFMYRLRVTDPNGNIVEMDPGGANMNGSS